MLRLPASPRRAPPPAAAPPVFTSQHNLQLCRRALPRAAQPHCHAAGPLVCLLPPPRWQPRPNRLRTKPPVCALDCPVSPTSAPRSSATTTCSPVKVGAVTRLKDLTRMDHAPRLRLPYTDAHTRTHTCTSHACMLSPFPCQASKLRRQHALANRSAKPHSHLRIANTRPPTGVQAYLLSSDRSAMAFAKVPAKRATSTSRARSRFPTPSTPPSTRRRRHPLHPCNPWRFTPQRHVGETRRYYWTRNEAMIRNLLRVPAAPGRASRLHLPAQSSTVSPRAFTPRARSSVFCRHPAGSRGRTVFERSPPCVR
jgi:hypothetical protein